MLKSIPFFHDFSNFDTRVCTVLAYIAHHTLFTCFWTWAWYPPQGSTLLVMAVPPPPLPAGVYWFLHHLSYFLCPESTKNLHIFIKIPQSCSLFLFCVSESIGLGLTCIGIILPASMLKISTDLYRSVKISNKWQFCPNKQVQPCFRIIIFFNQFATKSIQNNQN